ncbi:MAG: type II/IV secretion system protein, partial [Pirellulales bacterium]|nr:type II/IV secretion system protein [Pirellulales bacterium]
RRICPKCRRDYDPPRNVRKALEQMGYALEKYFKGVGCKSCRNTGFKGRIGVHELLMINDEIRDAISSNPTTGNIQRLADANGMTTLRDDGFRKVREGITTIEEVFHVAGDAGIMSSI